MERSRAERVTSETDEITMEARLNTTLDELHAAVLALPEGERAQLAARILASLETDPEVEAAWVAEVRDRLAAYKRGEIGTVSAEEVLAKARKIVGR